MPKDKRNNILGIVLLLLSALVWGFAFPAQRSAAGTLSAISFNGMRFYLAAATLVVIYVVYAFFCKKRGIKTVGWNKSTILGGALLGAIVFVANNLQQVGIEGTTAGKGSFITALYIVLVPILGLLARKRPSVNCWFAVIVSVCGFYLMCVSSDLKVTRGDMLVLLSAVMFSFHILFVDIFAKECDPIKLTLVQFVAASLISLPAMAIDGFPQPQTIGANIFAVLYVGILSAGIGFSLQTAGQKYTEPAIATLLMSLEAVFGLIGGVLFLHEVVSARELGGCLLVFIGVYVAQITIPHKFLRLEKSKLFYSA